MLLFVLFLVSCTGNVTVETLKEGPFVVTQVIDGDTLELETGERVRLSGINTPETGECYYLEAKQRLTTLVLGKKVYLEQDRTLEDKYGRLLRYIYLDDILINEILVQEGYAKVYDKYKEDTQRYEQLKEKETFAIKEQKGVWNCPDDPFKNCLFVGSKNSKTYHNLDCKYVKRIKPENIICYHSLTEVEGLKKSIC